MGWKQGMSRYQKNLIPTFVGIERGHTGLQKRVNFKNSLGGNWACLHFRKGEFPNLLCWKLGTPELRRIEMPNWLGLEWGMSGCQKNEFPHLLGLKGGTPNCRKGRISRIVWDEIGPVSIAEKVNF